MLMLDYESMKIYSQRRAARGSKFQPSHFLSFTCLETAVAV
jgi:hypothetical protein